MIYDFILVGHGLAGGILARTLSRQGYRLVVFDTYKANSASRVAAGLINPLAGKRFAKSWLAEKFVPYAINFYQEIEQELAVKLWYELPIFKLFSSIEEQNTWMGKSVNPAGHEFIKQVHVQLPTSDNVHQEFGAIEIQQGGYVDVNLLVDSLLQNIEQQQLLAREPFVLGNLTLSADFVAYKREKDTIQARKIVFCEGFQAVNNPFFSWLPFSLNKGEVLAVEMNNFVSECIYNKAVYVLPVSGNRYKVGATYNWREVNENVTPAARQELSERLGQVIKKPFRVTQQYAGIRPAVRDRRPLIGWHPQYTPVGIFNGMGSKGVMMAPYLARNFTDSLTGALLEPEAAINRYLKFYEAINT